MDLYLSFWITSSSEKGREQERPRLVWKREKTTCRCYQLQKNMRYKKCLKHPTILNIARAHLFCRTHGSNNHYTNAQKKLRIALWDRVSTFSIISNNTLLVKILSGTSNSINTWFRLEGDTKRQCKNTSPQTSLLSSLKPCKFGQAGSCSSQPTVPTGS